MLTLDFTDLTSADVLREGLELIERSSRKEVTIHSLHDLEVDLRYITSRGATVRRTLDGMVVLADQIVMALDGSAITDRGRQVSQDEASLAEDALQHVRSLRADPGIESLAGLERTLISVSNSVGWLEAFLKLDGLGALLDVLSHSQSRFTQLATDEQLQVRCVSCLGILVRRPAALEALLSQPHAITCVVAALDVRSHVAQEQVVQVCRGGARGRIGASLVRRLSF